MRRVFKSVLALILISGLVFAGTSDLKFRVRSLNINGIITYVSAQDFNGDGRVDLMAVTENADSLQSSRILFFFNDPVIPDKPDLVFTPDISDVFFTTEEVERKNGKELIFLGAAGISIFTFKNKISSVHKKAVAISTLIPPDKADLLKYDFTADVDGDSIAEIFVPSIGRIEVFKKGSDDNYSLLRTLITEPEISVLSNGIITYQFSIPEIKIENIDKGGNTAAILKYSDRIEVFHTDRFYKFQPDSIFIKPDTTIFFKLVDPSATGTDSRGVYSSLILSDLNNDGLFDVVHKRIVRTSALESMIEVYVYLNQGGSFSIEPNNVFVSESFGGEVAIQDFNNDGFMDFAIFRLSLGLAQVPAYIFKRKLSTKFDIYLMKPSGRYSDKPESSADIKIGILPEDIPAYRPCFSFKGDFNKDNYKDLIAETGKDKFSIYLNRGTGKFNSSSDYSFQASSCSKILILDADNNGTDDIVLWDKNHIQIVQNFRRKPH